MFPCWYMEKKKRNDCLSLRLFYCVCWEVQQVIHKPQRPATATRFQLENAFCFVFSPFPPFLLTFKRKKVTGVESCSLRIKNSSFNPVLFNWHMKDKSVQCKYHHVLHLGGTHYGNYNSISFFIFKFHTLVVSLRGCLWHTHKCGAWKLKRTSCQSRVISRCFCWWIVWEE